MNTDLNAWQVLILWLCTIVLSMFAGWAAGRIKLDDEEFEDGSGI